jgi:hypothetical protein
LSRYNNFHNDYFWIGVFSIVFALPQTRHVLEHDCPAFDGYRSRLLLGCLVKKSTSNIDGQISYQEHGNLTSFVAMSELAMQQMNARFPVGSEWPSIAILHEHVANEQTSPTGHKTLWSLQRAS